MSSRLRVSSPDQETVLDTVVLMYFLLVGEGNLLAELLGDPLRAPRAVYDPEDRGLPEEAMRHIDLLSEMRQAVSHYETNARLSDIDPGLVDQIRHVDDLFDSGNMTVVDMSEDERAFAAALQSRDGIAGYDLRVPLGPGEAACVAIAWKRGWKIATDDTAALKVLEKLHGGHTYPYERIRKLLVRAAEMGHITKERANEIHAEMRDLGFWDSGIPFP